jgi:putative glutamine amidotransferase
VTLIGLTPVWDEKSNRICMPNDYINAIVRAGALPVVLPLTADHGTCEAMLNRMDGLLFTGGADISPQIYNEVALPCCDDATPLRDEMEQFLMKRAIVIKKPFLAICRGMQMLACVTGGTLYQDVKELYSAAIIHSRSDIGREYAHTVDIKAGSMLETCEGGLQISVNSRHHQGVKKLGSGVVATAIAPDGLVEAIEFEVPTPAIGVQWHPESLADRYKEAHALFSWLINASNNNWNCSFHGDHIQPCKDPMATAIQ